MTRIASLNSDEDEHHGLLESYARASTTESQAWTLLHPERGPSRIAVRATLQTSANLKIVKVLVLEDMHVQNKQLIAKNAGFSTGSKQTMLHDNYGMRDYNECRLN